jgi:hypothetical protein
MLSDPLPLTRMRKLPQAGFATARRVGYVEER